MVLRIDWDFISEDTPFLTGTLGQFWEGRAFTLPEAQGSTLVVDPRYPAISLASFATAMASGRPLQTIDGVGVARFESGRPAQEPLTLPASESACIADPAGRARAERVIRRAHVTALEAAGVHIVDPDRVTIDPTVTVAPGATLWPDVVLLGATRIAEGAEIQSGCWISDTRIGARSIIKPHTVCEDAEIGADCAVGPMAHLRPGSVLEGENKVGNFVETKKAHLGQGAKASHLSYLGDAEVGRDANIGAGTITCNYDGFRKHRTTIGERAFIGSNSALVAPITIGAGAVVGAGSAIAKSVPDDGLAIVRADTRILKGKGKALNDRNARLKAAEKAK